MKRQVKWQPHEIVLMLLSLAAGVFLWIAPGIWGATDYTTEVFGNPEMDTVIVVRYNVNTGVLHDSTERLAADSAFPHTVVMSWDDSKDYSMYVLNHYTGEGWFSDVPFMWHKFTGVAATVDLGRIYDTIATAMSDSILGAGPYTVTFTVWDSTTASPAAIPNAHVTIKNQGQTAILARTLDGGTDANGDFAAGLELGWVKAITRATGYVFTIANDNFEIDSTEVDTIFGYAVSPTASGSPTLCTVYGDLLDDPSGVTVDVENLKVTFTLANDCYNICDSMAFVQNSVSRYTNAAGRFEVPLIYSSCLALHGDTATGNIKYDMSIGGWSMTRSVTVPDSATYRITWQ